jgi:hypothetical protein
VKEFLSREGHAYVERRVDEDFTAYQELAGRGLRVVPVTVIGEVVIKGFDEGQLRTALGGGAPP